MVSIQSSMREAFMPTLKKLSVRPGFKLVVAAACLIRPSCFPSQVMGYELCATEETALSLTEAGLEVTHLHWPESGLQPNIDELIRTKQLQMVFMFSNQLSVRRETNYAIRRLATDYNVPLITNLQVAEYFIDAIEKMRAGNLLGNSSLQEYWERDGN